MADEKPAEDAKKEEPKSGGAIKAMLPLILTVVLMPVMAFVMTNFILLPKIQKAIVASASTTDDPDHESTEVEGAGSEEPAPVHGEKEGEAPKPGKGAKTTFQLPKLIVNVRGTMGTRFLMSSFTLVGKGPDFVKLCENNDAQMRDVAMGVLAAKTIQDLEKPDSRNMIRTEMISTFNTALGQPAVNEIFITEFAIQ